MTETVDVVIIGAGFSGLYATYRLSKQYKVICFEKGAGVGGTWYWNRYPGARVDIQSVEYSYSFDEDLQQDWKWPEYFSAQPDLERYANHVADRFDLRKHIRLSNAVESLRFDAENDLWDVRTSAGDHVRCRYVIAATGALSIPNEPPWPGREDYEGVIYHTTDWPREPMDLSDKRVGLIGTGSTGVQAAPILAEEAKSLTVFQRTPAYSMPSGNRAMDEEHERDWKANYPERREEILNTWGTSMVEYGEKSVHECSEEERTQILERAWNSKSAFQLQVAFTDVMTDMDANEVVAEFIRNKIRAIVDDPETAERLCPKTYPVGGKRMCIDNGYYQTFNRDNVSLVDVRSAPIVEFTRTGLRTTEGEYDLDVIVMATGFDAVTGSLMNMDVEGIDGIKLTEKWKEGPTTYLGYMIAGFPNLLMVHGPMTPGAQAQMITTGEWQVDYLAELIDSMEAAGKTRVDTTEDAEQWWYEETQNVAMHMVHRHADSWYNAKNIEGKKGGFMIYVGGFPRFAELSRKAAENGWEGFELK